MNRVVIDALTAAYMAKRRLEIAMQNGDDHLQAQMAALFMAQSEERRGQLAGVGPFYGPDKTVELRSTIFRRILAGGSREGGRGGSPFL